MWQHFEAERARGRTPTGAELDRVAGTNNYGRAVLARWRRTGRIPDGADRPQSSRPIKAAAQGDSHAHADMAANSPE